MIVVDTSALICAFLREPGFERVRLRLSQANSAVFPAPCYLEFTSITKLGDAGRAWIDQMIEDGLLTMVAFEPVHARIAADVVATYGKGSGHPARLNFGDCMTYAVAKERGLPLLYVGNDFRHTDIPDALNAE